MTTWTTFYVILFLFARNCYCFCYWSVLCVHCVFFSSRVCVKLLLAFCCWIDPIKFVCLICWQWYCSVLLVSRCFFTFTSFGTFPMSFSSFFSHSLTHSARLHREFLCAISQIQFSIHGKWQQQQNKWERIWEQQWEIEREKNDVKTAKKNPPKKFLLRQIFYVLLPGCAKCGAKQKKSRHPTNETKNNNKKYGTQRQQQLFTYNHKM